MRSLLIAALVAGSTSVASAGYLGVGIGTAPVMGSSADVAASPTLASDGNRSLRLLLGTRFGRLSLEGAAGRFGMTIGGGSYDSTELDLGLKYSFPLGNNFELFGRGGVERTYLTDNSGAGSDYSGNGWFLAAGFEYRLDLLATSASIFIDLQQSSTTFDSNATSAGFDATARMWTLGATFSL